MTYGVIGYSGNQPSPQFAPLALGGGGWITGLDVHSDGTLVGRTDTYGCYLGNVTAGTKWQSLLSIASMPANAVGFNAAGTNFNAGIGVYEIRIAPSNSSILYMLYSDGDQSPTAHLSVFKSTNKGQRWTKLTNFPTSITWVAGTENDPYRMGQQKMAIHPTDPNTVLIGTPANGVYYTTDGGSSFTHITGVTAGTADANGIFPGISGICFDPATPTTCYAASFGNGVYRSTTGVTGTWSLISSSPQYVSAGAVNSGNYWCTGKSTTTGVTGGSGLANALFEFNGTSFSTATLTPDGNGLQSLAFIPGFLIVTSAAGMVWVGTLSGGSVTSWNNGPSDAQTLQATDVPWIALTNRSFLSAGGLVADPITTNQVFQGIGIGVVRMNANWATADFSTTTPWISQTAGIEQLVARKALSPPNGVPLIAVEDRGVFQITNPAVFPSDYSTRAIGSAGTCASWTVDYAKSSPATVAQVSNTLSTDVSGLSSSKGQAGTWSAFPTNPNAAANRNGDLAISTPLNAVFFNLFADTATKYTLDGGTTWTVSTGLPTSGWAPGSQFDNPKILCADDAGNGTFYIYNHGAGAIYRSTDGGATWTSILTGLSVNSFFEPMLVSVPGQSGHLFFAPGLNGGGVLPLGNALYRSTNANGSATKTTVSNVQDVWAIGFGAIASGQSYPTVWIVGWVSGVYGMYVSKDNCVSWTLLTTYPFNSCDQIVTISGDASDPSKCYYGFQGSGAGYGHNLVY